MKGQNVRPKGRLISVQVKTYTINYKKGWIPKVMRLGGEFDRLQEPWKADTQSPSLIK